MASRKQNERRFAEWEDLPDGGRRYYRIRMGKVKGYVRYIKVVDANELTLSFVQEVYDDDGRLLSTHQKHPEDTGHQDVSVEEDTE